VVAPLFCFFKPPSINSKFTKYNRTHNQNRNKKNIYIKKKNKKRNWETRKNNVSNFLFRSGSFGKAFEIFEFRFGFRWI
jgi:hypothetical protein